MTIIQNFQKLPSPISYLFNRMTPIFHLSNHALQPTKSVVNNGPGPVSLEVFILAHYGPPSTETPTTTIVQCHKNGWIYLTTTYYWWLLRPTITIQFDSKFQIIAQLFDSIRNEKTQFAQHYWRDLKSDVDFLQYWVLTGWDYRNGEQCCHTTFTHYLYHKLHVAQEQLNLPMIYIL